MAAAFWTICFFLVLTAALVIVFTYRQRCSCRKYRLGFDHRIIDEDENGIERIHSRGVCIE